MFTGIVRHMGRLQSAAAVSGGKRLVIDVGPLADGLGGGDSVCVNGVCLTVATLSGAEASFDVIAETLAATTLGSLSQGARLNLERALRLDGRLDGHLVQGHVDGTAELVDIRQGDRCELTFKMAAGLAGTLVAKGSVAIDGVSLTVAGVSEETFRVALIPTTLAETTLGDLKRGDKINVETDVIGKYVQRFLQQLGSGDRGGGLTLEKLKAAGFC